MTRPEKVIPELCQGYLLSTCIKAYTKKDIILYALGLGVSENPLDLEDLKYTYEQLEEFSILPSYLVVIPPIEDVFGGLLSCPGIPNFNPMMLLHGEEKIQVYQPIPSEATVECVSYIKEVFDKGKGALICIFSEIFKIEPSTGQRSHSTQPLCHIHMSVFIRGIGGFGGARGSKSSFPSKPTKIPDLTIRRPTHPNQAILYRLSGDTNPLHIDPNLAAIAGFDRPILHGLCTYGMTTHALIKHLAKNEGTSLKSIEARFSSPVTPGDELAVHIWLISPTEILFEVENLESKSICVADGRATFNSPIQMKNSNQKSSL